MTLYSLSTCPTCKKVRQFLESGQIEFSHIEVDLLDGGEQWLASKEVKRHNPAGTYPTLIVEEVITGFDEPRIKKALGLQ
ncbi:MAG TPA: glutaredoxin family protein [Dissulfurispiraceae bacterium]|nr:glutaredoxin family protein [Dissulfurispiraceae bacterium]